MGKTLSARHTLRFSLCVLSAAVLTACGGGGGGGEGDGSGGGGSDNTPQPDPTTPPRVEGKITYDYVPTTTNTVKNGGVQGGLDYTKTEKRPVRHALVEVLSEDGTAILGHTTSDDAGAYSLDVPADKRVYLRVVAQASDGATNAPDYAISIRDNTAPEYKNAPGAAPLYAMTGSVFSMTSGVTRRDLNAASGWTGAGYGAPRTAAPFAILDQTVNAVQQLHRAEPSVLLPALNIFWSVNNRPTSGDASSGFIGTSHYMPDAESKGLYILGAQNVDTDEYDASVIVHEFGHYVEANVSRSDTLGGEHSSGELLDMRVAFGEGFGNAFSSMVRGTPIYTDTIGPRQAELGVAMRLDQVPENDIGIWADEPAVGNFLYSISQSPDIGFAPLYHALLTGEKTTPALTSAFTFSTALRPALSDAGKRKLDGLLAAIGVQGGDQLDAWGTQTKLRGGSAQGNPAVFPIYLPLTVGQSIQACMTTQFGAGNKLGNYRHLRVTVPAAGMYRFAITAPDGDENTYGVTAYNLGKELHNLSEGQPFTTVAFPAAGDYAVDVWAQSDLDRSTARSELPHCVGVSVQSVNQ